MRPIHDRQVDYILGFAFVGTAATIITTLPLQMGPAFWVDRIDLLTLPLFVAGVVALFCGTRCLWALRVPIAFLLLAWPVPYLPLVDRAAPASGELTAGVMTMIAGLETYAAPAAAGANVFVVRHGATSFPVVIEPVWWGLNGLIGIAIVGLAVAYLVDGPRALKAVWLMASLVLVWVLYGFHIQLALASGALLGEGAAEVLLQPPASIVPFGLGAVVAVLSTSLFGLRRGVKGQWHSTMPVRRVRVVAALTCLVAIWLFHLSSGSVRYASGAGPLSDIGVVAPALTGQVAIGRE